MNPTKTHFIFAAVFVGIWLGFPLMVMAADNSMQLGVEKNTTLPIKSLPQGKTSKDNSVKIDYVTLSLTEQGEAVGVVTGSMQAVVESNSFEKFTKEAKKALRNAKKSGDAMQIKALKEQVEEITNFETVAKNANEAMKLAKIALAIREAAENGASNAEIAKVAAIETAKYGFEKGKDKAIEKLAKKYALGIFVKELNSAYTVAELLFNGSKYATFAFFTYVSPETLDGMEGGVVDTLAQYVEKGKNELNEAWEQVKFAPVSEHIGTMKYLFTKKETVDEMTARHRRELALKREADSKSEKKRAIEATQAGTDGNIANSLPMIPAGGEKENKQNNITPVSLDKIEIVR